MLLLTKFENDPELAYTGQKKSKNIFIGILKADKIAVS